MTSANQTLFDHQVAQAIRWVRLGNGETRALRRILRRLDTRLRKEILLIDPESAPFTKARAEAVRRQIKKIIVDFHKKETATFADTLFREVADLSAETELQAFRRVLPVGLDPVTPNVGILQTTLDKPYNGQFLHEWVDQLRDGDVHRTIRTIRAGALEGRTTSQIVRDVVGTRSLRYKDGAREVTRRGAETLVRTAINHASNAGRQAVWEQNADIVDKVRWVSTLDSRTSPICQRRDGLTFPINEGPRPPAHPNCRSTTVAVIKSIDELGIDIPEGSRASFDGQVPGNVTYREWIQRQSAAVQREALGPTRYNLLRKGEFEVGDFYNDKGEFYTLAQLRARSRQ